MFFRPLKTNEMFEVRLDKMVAKWAGSIEIGVTTHAPSDLGQFSNMYTYQKVNVIPWMIQLYVISEAFYIIIDIKYPAFKLSNIIIWLRFQNNILLLS